MALRVAANQAAVGISHWRKDQALISADQDLKASQIEMMRVAKLAAIGEIASDIAHEMTNPLQVLMLHIELMQMGRPLPNWTEMFVTQMKRLSDMTARLKSFARSVSGEVGMERVDLTATLLKTVDILQHEFEAKGVRFELALDDDLPPILGNNNYLIQMFLNLLTNASEAMPQGGTIGLSARLEGDRIAIGISDTGSGIPEEIRERVFKPFFSTKGETAAGLGLSICLKIARQHGGDIHVESEVGKGTEIRITLPVDSGRSNG
jgi:two-component system NtrC family sensor kinase